MAEIIFKNIPDNFDIYICIDDNPLRLYSNPQGFQIPIGEHSVLVVCKNKTDIKYKLDYLSSKHQGAFLPYCFNFEILSFKYYYKIRVLKPNGRILFNFSNTSYKNFLGYRSSQIALTSSLEKMYIIETEGPFFVNKGQKNKFEFFQIINIIFSLLPYLVLILFLLFDDINIILKNLYTPLGGYRSVGPQERILLIYVPFLVAILVLGGYLIFKLFKTSNSYWEK